MKKLAMLLCLVLFNTMVFSGVQASVLNSTIALGDNHTVVVKYQKALVFGSNYLGQLGIGQYDFSFHSPVVLQNFSSLQSVEARANTSVFLPENGEVYVSGNWLTGDRLTSPTLIEGLPAIKKVAMGVNHFIALDQNGFVHIASTESSGSFGVIENIPLIKEVSAGENHYLLLTVDGTIYSAGDNSFGQLGLSHFDFVNQPTAVENISNIQHVTAGYNHSMALDNEGRLYAWGQNNNGQIGNNQPLTLNLNTPVLLQSLPPIADIAAGRVQSVALSKSGEVFIWGWHNYIGTGAWNRSVSPVKMPEFSHAKAVFAGGNHTMILDGDDSLYAWGGNSSGALGSPDPTETHTPQKVILPQIISEYETGYLEGQLACKQSPESCGIEPRVITETQIEYIEVQIVPQEIMIELETLRRQVAKLKSLPCIRKKGDNGHGNDAGKFDVSNPGKSRR